MRSLNFACCIQRRTLFSSRCCRSRSCYHATGNTFLENKASLCLPISDENVVMICLWHERNHGTPRSSVGCELPTWNKYIVISLRVYLWYRANTTTLSIVDLCKFATEGRGFRPIFQRTTSPSLKNVVVFAAKPIQLLIYLQLSIQVGFLRNEWISQFRNFPPVIIWKHQGGPYLVTVRKISSPDRMAESTFL